jgi:hypothetical protein
MNKLRQIEKKYLRRIEYQNDYSEWDPSLMFNTKEAACLMNLEIVKICDRIYLPNPPTEQIGGVVGILNINDEIELIVRWIDHIDQYNKAEFFSEFKLVKDIKTI